MANIDGEAFSNQYIAGLTRTLATLPHPKIAAMLAALLDAHVAGRQVFLVGNGGSAATASHWQNDLTWGLGRKGIRPMRAIALTDNVPVMTAIANDSSYDDIFVVQLEALAQAGDVLVAITGSGNSPNVVRAAEWAKRKGMTTVGLLGMSGGRVLPLCDIAVIVDSSEYGPIEDAHMMLDHLALDFLRAALAP